MDNKISVYNSSFWDLWFQKIFRNFASVKYQWLALLYIPIVWGMFNIIPDSLPIERWISPTLGLSFLGGGFVTLALGRIIVRTSLKDTTGEDAIDRGMDTDSVDKRLDTDR